MSSQGSLAISLRCPSRTPHLAALSKGSISGGAFTKHRRGNANSLHCCSGALLLKQNTVEKNSRSPASCHQLGTLSEFVSQAVLQCPNCPMALLLPSRLIPKLQPTACCLHCSRRMHKRSLDLPSAWRRFQSKMCQNAKIQNVELNRMVFCLEN